MYSHKWNIHGIWQELYTVRIFGNEIYPTIYRKLWPFSLNKLCNSEETNGLTLILPQFHPIYTLNHLFYTHLCLMYPYKLPKRAQ